MMLKKTLVCCDGGISFCGFLHATKAFDSVDYCQVVFVVETSEGNDCTIRKIFTLKIVILSGKGGCIDGIPDPPCQVSL